MGWLWQQATDRFNKRTGRFIHYKHDPRILQASVLMSSIVSSKMQKEIFGLELYQEDYVISIIKQENLQPLLISMGLPDNTVYSILTDNKNHLWLGTDNGLSRFDPVTKTFYQL